MKRNRHSNKNNNVSIKDKFPVDSYCAEMTSCRNKLVGSSIPKSSKGILNFSKNQTVTVDELEKCSNKLAKPNTSINSSSAHTLLTKSKTDFYEKNVFQNKFYEVQKQNNRSSKKLIIVGEVHKSQNLNYEDCSKIIKEMRKKIRKQEEESKMKMIEVDEEIITKIKDLGYKQNDIDKNLKVPHTPVNNLYQQLVYKKKLELEEQQAAASVEETPIMKPKNVFISEFSYSHSPSSKQEETMPNMETIAKKFLKIKKKIDGRSRYHKIKFVEQKKKKQIDQ